MAYHHKGIGNGSRCTYGQCDLYQIANSHRSPYTPIESKDVEAEKLSDQYCRKCIHIPDCDKVDRCIVKFKQKRPPIGGRNKKQVEKAEEETLVEGNPVMPLKQPP